MNEMTDTSKEKTRVRMRLGSLGTRLTVINVAIIVLAILGLGYYMVYRNQQISAFLTDQLRQSVESSAQNSLQASTAEESLLIENYFQRISQNLLAVQGQAENLLSDTNIFNKPEYWNANSQLFQLPNGNWDNPNTQPGSVYVPPKALTESVIRDLNSVIFLDLTIPYILKNNSDYAAIYYIGRGTETLYYPNIDLASIIGSGFNPTEFPWYSDADPTHDPDRNLIWTDPYVDPAGAGILITHSAPLYDSSNRFRGIVAIDITLSQIADIVRTTHVGQTGYSFLIDSKGHVIAIDNAAASDFGISQEEITTGEIVNRSIMQNVPLELFEVLAKMVSGQTGVRTVTINNVEHYIAYRPIPSVDYSLGIVIPTSELRGVFTSTSEKLTQESQNTLVNLGLIIFFVLIAALAASLITSNATIAPLKRLTDVAQQIAAGNLNATAKIEAYDEIGTLATTMNNMTERLRDLITNLEERVEERTRLLEKRAIQVQAAAEVGSAATSYRDLESLLSRTTQLISARFGFYHVGIFLVDERGEYAVLRASNSTGGLRMLSRGHRLRVGAEGIVGTVTGTGQARIALNVGRDATYFDNPDLPDTRSEMAIPLMAGGQTLGALDIQSVEENAFSEEDVSTLRIMADQIAIALQNAKLFEETQEALEATQRAFGEVSREGWRKLLQEKRKVGFVSVKNRSVIEANEEWDPEWKSKIQKGEIAFSPDKRTIGVPVRARGQTIGAMRLKKPTDSPEWSSEEIEGIRLLAEQLSNTVDTARLYDEAQRRAARELAIGEVTSIISSSTNVESILRTTVQELGRQLSGTEVSLELNSTAKDVKK